MPTQQSAEAPRETEDTTINLQHTEEIEKDKKLQQQDHASAHIVEYQEDVQHREVPTKKSAETSWETDTE